jgi:hypothetical protein
LQAEGRSIHPFTLPTGLTNPQPSRSRNCHRAVELRRVAASAIQPHISFLVARRPGLLHQQNGETYRDSKDAQTSLDVSDERADEGPDDLGTSRGSTLAFLRLCVCLAPLR